MPTLTQSFLIFHTLLEGYGVLFIAGLLGPYDGSPSDMYKHDAASFAMCRGYSWIAQGQAAALGVCALAFGSRSTQYFCLYPSLYFHVANWSAFYFHDGYKMWADRQIAMGVHAVASILALVVVIMDRPKSSMNGKAKRGE